MLSQSGQYQRINNGEGDMDVEQGTQGAQSSSAALTSDFNPIVHSSSERAVREDEPPKLLRSKEGIPVPARPPFRGILCCRWLFVIALACLGLYRLMQVLTTQEIHLLEGIDKVSVNLKNCDFLSKPLGTDAADATAFLTLQHWNFMGSSDVLMDGSEIQITSKMRVRLNMFRCLITLTVSPGALPQILNTSSSGQDMSRFIMKAAPAKIVNLKVQQTYFEAASLPDTLSIKAKYGNIVLRPTKLNDKHEVSISTDGATLQVDSPSTTSVSLKGMAEQTSILSGPALTDVGGAVVLADAGGTSASPKLKVTFTTNEDNPGYFVVGSQQGHLFSRMGHLQSQPHPRLTNDSRTSMLEVSDWIKEMGSTTAPWVARVKLRGPGHQIGIWHAVSSEAFLALPVEAFMLLSAGSLHPSIFDASAQILSLPDVWPPSEQHGVEETKGLDDEHMWVVFNVLKEYFSVSAKSTIAWVPEQGKPIVFTKSGQKWSNYYLDLGKKQSLLFLIALLLNTLASAACATFVIWRVKRVQAGWNQLYQKDVSIASSHRLVRRMGLSSQSQGQGWQVMATQVDWPDHAVLLRWRKRTGTQLASFLYIYAKTDAQPARGMQQQEVSIQNVVADRVPTMKAHSVICEFLFSIAGVASTKGYEPKHEPLHYQHIYRFQIEGQDKSEEFLGRSSWSNEVFITPRSSVFDFPFLILKTFFPVPTPSLGFFLEKYANRHINGKIAQHIVVLHDMQISYHKNFRDFPECDSEFYLALCMGETAEICEEQTVRGRCITYARSAVFQPPAVVIAPDAGVDDTDADLDEEEKRTQKIPGELRVGSVDRERTEAIMTMRFASDHEDIAEAVIDWADLMEEFEDTDQQDEKYDQTYSCDLKTGADYSMYNEDYLVWFLAKLTFVNSIDSKCVALPKEQRFFSKDSPGQIFYQGMERFITWDQESELMAGHERFHLYATFPDCWWFQKKKIAANVSKKSVGVTFMVDFPRENKWNHVASQIEVYDENDEKIEDVVSHRFLVCRTWTLTDMELTYAAFCKLNNMAMEHLTADTLEKYNLQIAQIPLKVIPRLRAPLQFEEHEYTVEDNVLTSDGMFLIGNRPIKTTTIEENIKLGEVDDRASSDHGSSLRQALKKPVSSNSSSKLLAQTADGFQVFRSTSQKVQILEHIWARQFSVTNFAHGSNWLPSFLLVYAFYPVDNIMDALTWLAEFCQLHNVYSGAQSVFGSYRVDQFMTFTCAPLHWFLPFFAEALLFLLQLVMMMSGPTILLAIALANEYLHSSLHVALDFDSSSSKIESHIPDLVFQRRVSQRDIHSWWDAVSFESGIALVISMITVLLVLLLIVESNFCRNALPWRLQASAHMVFNYIGSCIISLYAWLLVVFSSMIVLWFTMAVVIYPEQMLAALACVAGVGIVLYGMLSQFRNTAEQINLFLRDEIPDILDLVCENYLNDFDRDRAARIAQLERMRVKSDQRFWRLMQLYLKERFSSNAKLAGRFAPLFAEDCEPSICVHKIFDHALIKEKHWDDSMIDLTIATATASMGNATSDNAQLQPSSDQVYTDDAANYRTDRVLARIGLEQHDTSGESHFSLRQRLLDRETESGGEMTHNYPKELREKLMRVFVRMLDQQQVQEDIRKVLEESTAMSSGIYRAHKAKLRLFDSTGPNSKDPQRERSDGSVQSDSGSSTLLELLIQHLHKQKMRNFMDYLAEHLDASLDPGNISEHVTPFIEKRIPDEIKKQLRLTLDEHTVGSAMQKVIENLRRWMGKIPDDQMAKHLTLERHDSKEGLRKTLTDIGVLHEDCHRSYWTAFARTIERKVRTWTHEDVTELVIDSSDAEEFVKELLQPVTSSGERVQLLWWGAMKQFLQKVGFPMTKNGDASTLSEKNVMREFEAFSMRDTSDHAFLPAEQTIDFLHKLTRGGTSDGSAGRLWKAQVVALMQEVGICGHLNLDSAQGATGAAASRGTREFHATTGGDVGLADMSGLPSYAKYRWPKWLEKAWDEVVPTWSTDPGIHASRKDETPSGKPFMPKTGIHLFFQNVAFSEYAKNSNPLGVRNFLEVNESYDNWFKGDMNGVTSLWCKRSKSFWKMRGIWLECFLGVLEKMDNGIDDISFALERFEVAKKECAGRTRFRPAECEGLLDIDEFSDWLKKSVVEVTSEVSVTVFKQVLKSANVSIPPLVAEYLWHAGDSTICSHPSLRKVGDLEERVVMYLAKGLVVESVRSLIFDELQVPALQELDEEAVQAAFDQVDDKTGQCGFLEPHEVQQMIRLIAQEGMTLDMLLKSFQRLKLHIPEKDVKAAFLMMDTNADDVIDVPEFLGMIDYFIVTLIPNQIFAALGLQVQQIAMKLVMAFCISIIVLLFVLISLGAFQVELNTSGTSSGASWVRAGIAIGAVIGLKGDSSESSQDKLFIQARMRLYEMMGVSPSQVEARRRSSPLGGNTQQMPQAAPRRMPKFRPRRGGGGGGRPSGHAGDKDDDDDDDDDNDS